jgi:hypothetical protein
MRFSSFLATIALAPILFAPSAATAESITYNIVDYSALGIQNNPSGQPVTISGTIVTDATTGIGLTSAGFIESWSLTFTQGADTRTYTSSSNQASAFIAGGGLDVTSQTITLHGDGELILSALSPDDLAEFTQWGDTFYNAAFPFDTKLPTSWYTQTDFFGAPTFSPIGVPEPASLTLLGIGIAGMAGYMWRRGKC